MSPRIDFVESLEEVLRRRREQLGMSQAALAAAIGVNLRQIRRYESGEQQPVLSVAVRLADALSLTMNELAGRGRAELNLSGGWWAAWQTSTHGNEVVTTQPIELDQHGTTIQV